MAKLMSRNAKRGPSGTRELLLVDETVVYLGIWEFDCLHDCSTLKENTCFCQANQRVQPYLDMMKLDPTLSVRSGLGGAASVNSKHVASSRVLRGHGGPARGDGRQGARRYPKPW